MNSVRYCLANVACSLTNHLGECGIKSQSPQVYFPLFCSVDHKDSLFDRDFAMQQSAVAEIISSMYIFVLKMFLSFLRNGSGVPHILYQLCYAHALCGNQYLPNTSIFSLHMPLIFKKPVSGLIVQNPLSS